jgi:hypothetical protein
MKRSLHPQKKIENVLAGSERWRPVQFGMTVGGKLLLVGMEPQSFRIVSGVVRCKEKTKGSREGGVHGDGGDVGIA